MKYFIPLVVIVLALQSCENTDFTVIERAEITGADSINIYVSGDILQLDIIRDVVIFVNDARGNSPHCRKPPKHATLSQQL
ncbi:MAG: hypothetical protein FWC64_05905 [Treponema sp.]|nr:hypothetical protein [Treponema sp.]